MADLADLTKLKAKVERMQREAAEAEGARKQAMERLKEEFDCDTLEQAEEKLEQLKQDETKAQRKFERALGKFQEEWGEVLNG